MDVFYPPFACADIDWDQEIARIMERRDLLASQGIQDDGTLRGEVEQKVEFARCTLGEQHPIVATLYGILGYLAFSSNELTRALECHQVAREIWNANRMASYPSIYSLILISIAKGDVLPAMGYALELCDELDLATEGEALDPWLSACQDVLSAAVEHELWLLGVYLGEFIREKVRCQAVLDKNLLARAHYLTARCQNALAWTQDALARLRLALECLQDSANPDGALMSEVLSQKAKLLLNMCKPLEAQAILQHAVKIDRDQYGEEEATLKSAFYHLGEIHAFLGETGEAERIYEHIVDTARKKGDLRQEYIVLNTLGVMHAEQNAFPKAESFFNQAMEAVTRVHGEGDPLLTVVLENLSKLYYNQNRLQLADAAIARALSLCEENQDLEPKRSHLLMIQQVIRERADSAQCS